MTNSISKAKEILLNTRRAPGMYALTRESFLNRVCTVLEMLDVDNWPQDFYTKHLGTYGSRYLTASDPVDDNWAHLVIDDALSIIESHVQQEGS